MQFPIGMSIETGEQLLASIRRWQRVAERKKFELGRRGSDLLNKDQPLYNKLECHFDDLDWLHEQIIKYYQAASEAAKKFAGKMDGTDKAQATREDITTVMEYEAATYVAAQLIRQLMHTFSTELAPELEVYPDLNKQILEILTW